MSDPVANRRPIKSRQMPVFQWLAARLAKTAIPSQPTVTVVGTALAVICIGGIFTSIRRLQKIGVILRSKP